MGTALQAVMPEQDSLLTIILAATVAGLLGTLFCVTMLTVSVQRVTRRVQRLEVKRSIDEYVQGTADDVEPTS